MSNKINPKLKEGDRIVLVHMDGESLGTGIKGKVTKIEQTPKFSSSDLGFQYAVEWYDYDDKVISRLSLIPESDAWILDSDYDIEPLQEIINIKDVDDEFEREYSLIIHDIMFDFKEYIKEEQLPFMNKLNMTGKYLVEDFFKYFSTNYNDIKDKVEKENEEYLKELEEEENELIEENSEYEKN
jgi:hypothetical protein